MVNSVEESAAVVSTSVSIISATQKIQVQSSVTGFPHVCVHVVGGQERCGDRAVGIGGWEEKIEKVDV